MCAMPTEYGQTKKMPILLYYVFNMHGTADSKKFPSKKKLPRRVNLGSRSGSRADILPE